MSPASLVSLENHKLLQRDSKILMFLHGKSEEEWTDNWNATVNN